MDATSAVVASYADVHDGQDHPCAVDLGAGRRTWRCAGPTCAAAGFLLVTLLTFVFRGGETSSAVGIRQLAAEEATTSTEEWHYGVCDDKPSWPDVTIDCGGCKARVNLTEYESTCDGFCGSQGLQCISSWAAPNQSCDELGWYQCSEHIQVDWAICECIAPCAASLSDCSTSKCCSSVYDSCFRTDASSEGTSCMPSCVPGKDGPCDQPFAHPLARARETWRWPDIACVLSAGVALVVPEAFHTKYHSSCQEYCVDGAGKTVAPEHYQFWIDVWSPREGRDECCPSDHSCEHRGIHCHCSFPDRL